MLMVQQRRGLPGFSRAGTAYSPSTGIPSGAMRPRFESGPFETGVSNLLAGRTEFQKNASSALGWTEYSGAAVMLTPGQTDPAGGAAAYRIEATGGTSQLKFYTTGVSPGVAGTTYYHCIWVRVRAGTLRVWENPGSTYQDVTPTSGWTQIKLRHTAVNTNPIQLQLRALLTTDNLDFDAWHPQVATVDAPYTSTSRPHLSHRGALMVEESGTNLMPYSDPTDITILSTRSGVTQTTGVADFLKGGAYYQDNVAYRYAYQSIASLQVSTTYAISAFVRMDDGGAPVIGTTNTAGDFSLIVANSIAAGSALVQNLGGGLYRVTALHTTGASISSTICGVGKYTGQSARGCKVSGFQVEQRSYATSYHPTNGASAIRAAETYTIPPAGILSPTQGTVEMWVYVDAVARRQVVGTNQYLVFIPKGSGSLGIAVYHMPDSANWRLGTIDDAGVLSYVNVADSYTPDGWHHVAVPYDATSAMLVIDGVERGSMAAPKLPTAFGTSIYLGSLSNGTHAADTRFADVRFSSVKRTAAEMAALYASGQPAPVDQYTTWRSNFAPAGRRLVI